MTRAVRSALASVALTALLAGCVSLPTSGPIGQGGPAPTEDVPAIPLPLGPQENANEEEIVTGFLRAAQAGVYQDYGTAREFLAPGVDWDPRPEVLVTSQNPTVTRVGDGAVDVEIELAATVDATGVYHEATPTAGPERELAFELRQVAGEWRISALPDGVVFRDSAFLNAYTPVRLYFATPDGTLGVPDVRYLPSTRSNLLLRAVQALLRGPSPWLRDGVVTALPNLASPLEEVIGPDADGAVVVALSSEVDPAGLPDGARELLQAQLEATLKSSNLGGIPVSGIAVTRRGSPWETTGGQVRPLTPDVVPTEGPYAIADDAVVVLRGTGDPEPVPDLPSLAGLAATHLATSLDGDVWVVLDEGRRLMLLPVGGEEPVELPAGDGGLLLPPSVDRHDWIWTGERSPSAGVLLAVSPEGEVVEVAAPWLTGREVRAVRVSRDGTRVAIASVGPDLFTTLEVVSVIRSGTAVPQLLSEERLVVGTTLTSVAELAWADGTSLTVLGTSGSDQLGVYRVPVSGPTDLAQQAPEGVEGIAAGRDSETVYAVDSAGVLRILRNASWVQVAEGVSDPVFPG